AQDHAARLDRLDVVRLDYQLRELESFSRFSRCSLGVSFSSNQRRFQFRVLAFRFGSARSGFVAFGFAPFLLAASCALRTAVGVDEVLLMTHYGGTLDFAGNQDKNTSPRKASGLGHAGIFERHPPVTERSLAAPSVCY